MRNLSVTEKNIMVIEKKFINQTFDSIIFNQGDVAMGCNFQYCTFINCEFLSNMQGVIFNFCSFDNCIFNNPNLDIFLDFCYVNAVFRDCGMDIYASFCDFHSSTFSNCYLIGSLRYCKTNKVLFLNSTLKLDQ